jgi:hypothetical protein
MKLSDEKSHSPEPPATKLENLVHFTTFAKIVEIKHRLLQILRLRAPYNINYTTHKKFLQKYGVKLSKMGGSLSSERRANRHGCQASCTPPRKNQQVQVKIEKGWYSLMTCNHLQANPNTNSL